MKKPLEIMARREGWSQGISVYIREVISNNKVLEAQPVIFKEHNPHIMSDPCMYFSIQESQEFMDELWRCGLRPSEGTGSAGSLKATEKHLADMRQIAFKKLNIT